MPVVRGIRVLNAISTGNTTPACLDTLLSDAGRLADVSQVLSSPQYACALSLSNTAAHTLVRSNNAMTALFGNPIGACIFYTTPNSRDDMLGSACYYSYMTAFATPEATCAFTHFGNSTTMINCAFGSCTAFLTTAVSSNSDITKMLTCNSCVSACFRGTECSMKEATGTAGRAAFWLSDATAFACLNACGLGTALASAGFVETLNRDMACVQCTAAFQCCIYELAAPACVYTQCVCAMNEIISKAACNLYETSCNFARWANSCYGITCMSNFLASGNTYFIDCMNSVGNFRQRACLYYLCANRASEYTSVICAAPTNCLAVKAHKLLKSEIVGRGGSQPLANNATFPMSYFPHCYGQRICNFTIANGSQLSNTEVEYLGRFIKCNYNVITHADCRFTMISPGFWNQSSAIACFRSCYCCSLDRTTANTSGLTLNCGLYFTTDNAASFNRLCVPLPACIFQQLCGNCCCQFTVRYALSTFACCNYVYTGWIISDCANNFGACTCCSPAYFKTGHSRVCIHAANSQPNYDTWTHYPDVPLPFYTIAFCDEYFAGVSPMRTDGYQSVLGLQNTLSCQCAGQYALMFSFGKVGDCVRISCDNFVRNQPTGLACFTPCTCINACCSLPAVTHCVFGSCYADYFQGHGSGRFPYCVMQGCNCFDNNGTNRIMPNPTAASHTLIYKNPANQADSKAFLVGWRSFGMLYGGNADTTGTICAMISGLSSQLPYNNATCRGSSEILPYGCGYFRNSPGVNIWCYGSQANNTMEGSELDCVNVPAIGGTATSWTNFTFANAKIIGCRLVLAGAYPPTMHLCGCCSCFDALTGYTAIGYSRQQFGGDYGCQNVMGQTGHTTVINTDGVVGTCVMCLESMYNQTPFAAGYPDGAICMTVNYCNYCSGECFRCFCGCFGYGYGRPFTATPHISDQAGLKTVNFYGTSNSTYSVAALPNMPPRAQCLVACSHPCRLSSTSCYASPAPSGCQVMKSDKSVHCTIDMGDAKQFQFGCCCCPTPVRPCQSWALCESNPGQANAIGFSIDHHTDALASYPCYFQSIYTPPNSNQLMTSFDSNYNFCYVISPHRDMCFGASGIGPYCWLQQCECFGPNCCLSVPCSPCCPNCNVQPCCSCGFYCGTCITCMPICNIVRPCFTGQHVCINYFACGPTASSPPRFCNAAIAGCAGFGNHVYATACANTVFQCAFATSIQIECGGAVASYRGFQCDLSCTCCTLLPYDRLLRTCNQAGPNCLWFDFISTGVSDWTACCMTVFLPCRTFWNKQYLMDMNLICNNDAVKSLGYNYMAADDNKRAGFRLYTSTSYTCCMFCVDSVCYQIGYGTQTRGSGGPLNTTNSVHIAYFDLIPFRCCSPAAGGGFFANGNPCTTAAAACSCCLMFIKQDLFYNC